MSGPDLHPASQGCLCSLLRSQVLSDVLPPLGSKRPLPRHLRIGLMADCCPKRLDDRPIFLAKHRLSFTNPMVGAYIRLPHQRQSSFEGQRGGGAKRSPPLALIIKKGLLQNHPLFSRSHPFSDSSHPLSS